jgi:hypothetical protein
MNVMLTRNPDGTANAEPGDAVEFVYGSEWRPAIYRGLLSQNTNTIDIAVLRLEGAADDFPTALAHVRHARGGAGHLRLQVARLREALSEVAMAAREDSEWDTIDMIRDDVDAYEFEEPQP